MLKQRSLLDPKTPLEIHQEQLRVSIYQGKEECKKLKILECRLNKPFFIQRYDLTTINKVEYLLYRPDNKYGGDRLNEIPFDDIVSVEIIDEQFDRNGDYQHP